MAEAMSLLYANGIMSRSPRVAVARRLPWDHDTYDIEPQRGSVPDLDLMKIPECLLFGTDPQMLDPSMVARSR